MRCKVPQYSLDYFIHNANVRRPRGSKEIAEIGNTATFKGKQRRCKKKLLEMSCIQCLLARTMRFLVITMGQKEYKCNNTPVYLDCPIVVTRSYDWKKIYIFRLLAFLCYVFLIRYFNEAYWTILCLLCLPKCSTLRFWLCIKISSIHPKEKEHGELVLQLH